MKITESTWANIGKVSALIAVAFASYYSVQAIANYKDTPLPNTDEGSDDAPSTPTASLVANHGGQLVSLELSDGSFMKGYTLPDDINEAKFPLQIIVKPKANLLGLGEGESIKIQKSAEGALFYYGMIDFIKGNHGVTYEELKQQALAL